MKYLFITVSLMLLWSWVFAQSFTRLEQMIIDTTTERINSATLDPDPQMRGLVYFSKLDASRKQTMIDTILAKVTTPLPAHTQGNESLNKNTATLELWAPIQHTPSTNTYRATKLESLGKTIDYQKVRDTRFSWINDARTARGLDPYSYHERLEYSAGKWTDIMVARGKRSHQRTIWEWFYNYRNIEQRFADLGLKFKNIQRTTFVENVGQPYFKCKTDDCTDAIIASLRTTFDFYMAEAGTKNDAHYRSIINPRFRIWWLAYDVSGSSLMVTIHYATEIVE